MESDDSVRFNHQDYLFSDDILTGNDNGAMSIILPDPVEWVRESEAYSFNNDRFAELYVESIVAAAVEELKPKPDTIKSRDIVAPIIDRLICDYFPSEESDGRFDKASISGSSSEGFSGWPKISEFNIKLGMEKLEEYTESWKVGEGWMSCVEFLGFESEEMSNYFVYEVEFTFPSPTYPIPQASASVYFSLEVSKMVPALYDRPIEVSYIFESSNVIHYPGKIDFQESWIKDIIHSKILLFRSILF